MTGSAILLCVIAGVIAFSRCKPTAYPLFYDLASAVGEANPKSGYPWYSDTYFTAPAPAKKGSRRSFGTGTMVVLRGVFTTAPVPTAYDRLTVIIIRKDRIASARSAFDKYFPPAGGNASWLALHKGSRSTVILEHRAKGTTDCGFATGGPAEAIAKEAGLALPAGGVVVTLTERPDWFTLKIQAIRRFLHLR